MSKTAVEADFVWLFSIAKAHNLSFQNVLDIAQIELGKPLREFSRKEIIEFGKRLCLNQEGEKK